MKLIKKEHQYSRNKYEYEVLEREEIEEIIDNLDKAEVSRKLIEKALEYSGLPAHAFVEMNVKDGDIVYHIQMHNTESMEPSLWIRLMNFGDVERMNDIPDDCILYPEEINEIHNFI